MSNRILLGTFSAGLAFFLPLLAGCGGGQPAVSGSVTLNGNPLEKGMISFQPVGQGRPEGGPIANGSYTVRGLSAGKYRVNVTATTGGPVPDSMEEGIKAAAKVEPNPIPPGTTGNNAEVDITGSSQTVDVKLTTPKK